MIIGIYSMPVKQYHVQPSLHKLTLFLLAGIHQFILCQNHIQINIYPLHLSNTFFLRTHAVTNFKNMLEK